nr:hypothetical protein [Tanacetum cinerariifolium]
MRRAKRQGIILEKEQVKKQKSSEKAPETKHPLKNLQRQHSELLAKFQAQEVEILRLKERVNSPSRGIDVPTGSGSIPTAGPPAADISTGSEVVPTASPSVTSYSRRKGKEVMVESDTPKKQRLQEQIDA